jgi:hypothetical protein
VTVSTDSSTPVDYLLRELARVRAVNRRQRRRIQWLRESREAWKHRALRRGL